MTSREKPESRAAERDEVLKRMLKMPPKPHKGGPGAKKPQKPKPNESRKK